VVVAVATDERRAMRAGGCAGLRVSSDRHRSGVGEVPAGDLGEVNALRVGAARVLDGGGNVAEREVIGRVSPPDGTAGAVVAEGAVAAEVQLRRQGVLERP
jgi:hypothetical protein